MSRVDPSEASPPMSNAQIPHAPGASAHTASFSLKRHPLSIEASVAITPGGLLAIAALVSGILLSTAVLVRAAKKR